MEWRRDDKSLELNESKENAISSKNAIFSLRESTFEKIEFPSEFLRVGNEESKSKPNSKKSSEMFPEEFESRQVLKRFDSGLTRVSKRVKPND